MGGIELMLKETKKYEAVIRKSYEECALVVFGGLDTPGLAAYAYGSPGRYEMVGGDSDADVFLIELERNELTNRFKSEFRARLSNYPFSKIDLPDWGTLDEIEVFLKTSLVEGNQVLETRYLIGDPSVESELKLLKEKYGTIKREITNILFNRQYLNFYYRQAAWKNAYNIKFTRGGSRDLLISSWYESLVSKLDQTENSEKMPKCTKGVKRLVHSGRLGEDSYNQFIDSVANIGSSRGTVLLLNKGTTKKATSILDCETAMKFGTKKESIKMILELKDSLATIEEITNLMVEDVINLGSQIYGYEWEYSVRMALSGSSQTRKKNLPVVNDDVVVSLLWGAHFHDQKWLFNEVATKHVDSKAWAIVASIASSPLCNADYLSYMANSIAKKLGYGYILRIIAKNPNVTIETLRSIAEDPALEERYTEVAKSKLKNFTY